MGIAQKGKAVWGLIVLNWVLILDAIAIVIVGSAIWFYTLKEQNTYHAVYEKQSPQTIIDIQNKVR